MTQDNEATVHAAVGTPVDQRVVPLVPKRVQLSRAKGWRMPENTVKVDRATRWGNPFKLHGDGYPMTPELAVALFERYVTDESRLGWVMASQLTNLEDVRRQLRGKNLACWCRLDWPCHADVLLRLANDERHNGPGEPTRRR